MAGRNVLHGNEEDWAARARAWAAAKAASENPHAPSQFTPIGRIEDHNHAYNDQYQQTVDPHLTDIQKLSLPVLSSPQMPVPMTNPHRSSAQVLPESASFSSGSSSYVSDVPASYSNRDGAPYSMSPSQGSVLLSSSIYQQEVPCSYSTIPGNASVIAFACEACHGGSGSQNEKFHTSLPPAVLSHQEPQPHSWPPPVPAIGRSSVEQLQVMHQDCSAESATDVHNQSSDFEHGPHQTANYMHPDPAGVVGGMEHVAVASSMHSWTSGTAVTPGAAFPPIPPQGPQFDLPPPVPGHTTPMFGRISGPGFRPGIPPVGPAFGVSTGTALHSPTAFPGDTNGVFNVSERPKKASVPNWLREEIIKKKAVIASSSIQDQPAEDSFNSVGAEGDEKTMRRSDQVDNKSSDSARSNEDEEDEDDVEAARTAAINQEIKRILTEVLLKVTDELFDEIATKVLSEDDLMVEAAVENGSELVNHKVSPPPTVSTPKASTEVLIPIKVKKKDNDDATEKSTSSSPGDVLGLANYASDDDDDDDDDDDNDEDGVESSHPTKQANGTTHERSDDTFASELVPEAEERGTSGMSTEVSNGVQGHLQSSAFRNGTNLSLQSSMNDVPRKGSPHTDNELICDGGSQVANEGLENSRDHIPVETGRIVGSSHQHAESSDSKDNFKRKDLAELKPGHGNAINEKPDSGGSQVREARSRSSKEEKHEDKRSSVGKDSVQGANAVEVKTNQKHSDSGVSKKGSGRDVRNEKGADERNNSSREKGKAWESEPRSSHGDKKDARKETEKVKPVNGKEDSNRKRDRQRDEMEDRSRHRDERDSHRYKRRRSPSAGSRAKDSKENSLVSHASASDDETSENSRHSASFEENDVISTGHFVVAVEVWHACATKKINKTQPKWQCKHKMLDFLFEVLPCGIVQLCIWRLQGIQREHVYLKWVLQRLKLV
ncbi:hypothetical protein ACLOJK_020902 [Asimina triloba]